MLCEYSENAEYSANSISLLSPLPHCSLKKPTINEYIKFQKALPMTTWLMVGLLGSLTQGPLLHWCIRIEISNRFENLLRQLHFA